MKKNISQIRVDRELYARITKLHELTGRPHVHIVNTGLREYVEKLEAAVKRG